MMVRPFSTLTTGFTSITIHASSDIQVEPWALALTLLKAGRGVPVHAEAFPAMAQHWEGLDTVLDRVRPGRRNAPPRLSADDKEDLVDDLSDALEACCSIALHGDGSPPLFAVACKDVFDWFEETRLSVLDTLPSAYSRQFVERVQEIRRQGIDQLALLKSTSFRVPELDGSAGDSAEPDALKRYEDPEVAVRLLVESNRQSQAGAAMRLLNSTHRPGRGLTMSR